MLSQDSNKKEKVRSFDVQFVYYSPMWIFFTQCVPDIPLKLIFWCNLEFI